MSNDATNLVSHTRELYAAILRTRQEMSSLVLKDLGDSIYDSIPWESLDTPVKQALLSITSELRNANTQAAITEIRRESIIDAQTAEENESESETEETDEIDDTPIVNVFPEGPPVETDEDSSSENTGNAAKSPKGDETANEIT